MHEGDEPNPVADLFDADVLTGEDSAEIDLRRLKQMRPRAVTMPESLLSFVQ